jgi:hypothetical protein
MFTCETLRHTMIIEFFYETVATHGHSTSTIIRSITIIHGIFNNMTSKVGLRLVIVGSII